jgi:dipeptidyl aminopeptidase/acylaminoacyl peptidase
MNDPRQSSASRRLVEERATFSAAGQAVVADIVRRPDCAPCAGLLLLHGRSGPISLARLAPLTDLLAESGFAVMLPHFFKATQSTRPGFAEIERHFDAWAGACEHAVRWLREQPWANPHRCGVIGYSLGGYLAMRLALSRSPVQAVVCLAGGADARVLAQPVRVPPTLILHGANDTIVPASEAATLHAWLRHNGTTCEAQIFPGEGHFFSPGVALPAFGLVASFLERHLTAPASRR